MPTVSELKAQERRFEEAGDTAGALAMYQGLLREFERCVIPPDDQPALYTRVGDLQVHLRRPASAFGSYQQAAEHYARLGSGEDINELCIRMINVVPAAGDSYVLYARRLYEHGHVESALDVLREYAGKADLDRVSDAVNALAGLSSEEMRPRMMELLNAIEGDRRGQALVAERVSADLRKAVPETPSVTEAPPVERASTPPERVVEPEMPVVGRRREVSQPEEQWSVTDLTGGPEPRLITPRRPPARGYRKRRAERTRDVARYRGKYVGGAIVIIAAMGLVILAIASMRQEPTSTVTSQLVETATDLTPTQPARPVPAAPTVEQLENTTAPNSTANTPGDTADPSSDITEPITVGDLVMRSVSDAEYQGRRGFRVVHLLDSGAQFIVESYPVDTVAASRYRVGTVIISAIPPDTTVSIVRFDERYLVFASGLVPEDSMRVLMGLLRIREPSD